MLKEKIKIFKRGINTYKVSNYGYVLSYKTYVTVNGKKYLKKKRKLKVTNNGNGYFFLNLGKGFENRFYIHILIGSIFVKNPNMYKEINHIDGDKSNNKSDNLEWVTKKENVRHAIQLGLIKTRGNSKMSKKVYSINGEIFDCVKDASDFYCINYGTLKDALSKKEIYKGLSYKKI